MDFVHRKLSLFFVCAPVGAQRNVLTGWSSTATIAEIAVEDLVSNWLVSLCSKVSVFFISVVTQSMASQ